MSVPVLNAAATLSPFDSILQIFNTNPYFIGITMLLMNLGGRFLTLDVTKKQEQFFQHPWIRRLLIFIVIFMGTRSIWVAFWATLVVILLMGYLFNENSALCIFGQGGTSGATCSTDSQHSPTESMSAEEREILMRLQAKANRMNKAPVTDDAENETLYSDVYAANMSLLRR
jgi:hypothetical protein